MESNEKIHTFLFMRKKGFGTANQASTFLLQIQTRKDKKTLQALQMPKIVSFTYVSKTEYLNS